MLKAKLVKKRQIDRYASAGRVHYWGYAPQYLRARVVSPLSHKEGGALPLTFEGLVDIGLFCFRTFNSLFRSRFKIVPYTI